MNNLSVNCATCIKFKKPVPHPAVCLSKTPKFMDVALNLKVRKQCYFLVIIVLATRLCAATVIKNTLAATVIKAFFISWITSFGAPNKLLTGDGCVFINLKRDFGEAFNVKVITTTAESPWGNGVCERLNAVIDSMLHKIIADIKCDVEVAPSWAVFTCNALVNHSVFFS